MTFFIARRLGMFAPLLVLAGCQTMDIGVERQVEFVSEPAGAVVSTSVGSDSCTTPCTLTRGSKQEFRATFRLDGYKEAVVDVKSKVTGAGGAVLAASVVLGGVGGLAGTKIHGMDLYHEPNPVKAVLERSGPAPKAPPKAAPKGKQKAAPAPAPAVEESKPAEES